MTFSQSVPFTFITSENPPMVISPIVACAVLGLSIVSCDACAGIKSPPKRPPTRELAPVHLTTDQVQRFQRLISEHRNPRILVVAPPGAPSAVQTFAAEFRNYLAECRVRLLDLDRLDARHRREIESATLTDDVDAMRQLAARQEAGTGGSDLAADMIIRIDGQTAGGQFNALLRLTDLRRGLVLANLGFPIELNALPYNVREKGVAVFPDLIAALERSVGDPWRFDAIVHGVDNGRQAEHFVRELRRLARESGALKGSTSLEPELRDEWRDQRGSGSRLQIEVIHRGHDDDVRDVLHAAAAKLDPPLRLEFTSRSPVVSIAYALDATRPAWDCVIEDACDGPLRTALVELARREGRNRFAIVLEESTAVDSTYFRGLADAIATHFRSISFERVAESEDGEPVGADYVVLIGTGSIDGRRSAMVRMVRVHDGRRVELASEFWPNPVIRSTGEVRVDDRDPRSLGRYLGGSLLTQLAESNARDGTQRRILVTVSNVDPDLVNDVRQRLAALPAQRRLGRADLVDRTWQVELWYGGNLDDLKAQVTDHFRGSGLTIDEISDRGIWVVRAG